MQHTKQSKQQRLHTRFSGLIRLGYLPIIVVHIYKSPKWQRDWPSAKGRSFLVVMIFGMAAWRGYGVVGMHAAPL